MLFSCQCTHPLTVLVFLCQFRRHALGRLTEHQNFWPCIFRRLFDIFGTVITDVLTLSMIRSQMSGGRGQNDLILLVTSAKAQDE
jgi:hypothetical protein